MSSYLKIEGIEDLKKQLRDLPSDLAEFGHAIVMKHARIAEARIQNNYEAHRHTGELAKSVGVKERDVGRYGSAAIVVAAAYHAHLFEFGTAARHSSKPPPGHGTGVMPPAPAVHSFIPVMEHERREMWEEIAQLLERNGMRTHGHATGL